jgi:hypothetical protein
MTLNGLVEGRATGQVVVVEVDSPIDLLSNAIVPAQTLGLPTGEMTAAIPGEMMLTLTFHPQVLERRETEVDRQADTAGGHAAH